MNQNIGMTDRVIRIIVAIAAAVLGYYISPWFYLITVIALITSVTGFCGLYSLLGINTCKSCALKPAQQAQAAKPAQQQKAAQKKPAKKKAARKKKR